MDPVEITLAGKPFAFVRRSRRGDVAVYTSGNLYARVGERELVERMLALHKQFDAFGFPVPQIVEHGEAEKHFFYIEKSLGAERFSELFKKDIEKNGSISSENFEKFISISEDFAIAQLRSVGKVSRTLSVDNLIGPKDLAEELPQLAGSIMQKYEQSLSTLSAFPLVLTQGDFNPNNLFPAGVIDFEQPYYCPFGYDLVTNIFHISYFPSGNECEFEYCRSYFFTEENEELYYNRLDRLFINAGLPALSVYKKHFEFLRAIWSTARNFRAPKLQQFRYKLFEQQYFQNHSNVFSSL